MNPMTGDPHPPKVEIFDVEAMSNTDPKGVRRDVEEYRLEPFGLYMARSAPGRRQFHFLESWLLPDLGVRITDFWFSEGHVLDQDFYLDIVSIERGTRRWVARDLYVDIVLRTGKDAVVLDTDELIAAVSAGLLSPADAVQALETTYATIDALAANEYDLGRWLAAHDIALTWRRH